MLFLKIQFQFLLVFFFLNIKVSHSACLNLCILLSVLYCPAICSFVNIFQLHPSAVFVGLEWPAVNLILDYSDTNKKVRMQTCTDSYANKFRGLSLHLFSAMSSLV